MTQWLLPAVNGRDFPTVVDEFCLYVKLSPNRSLFVASPNLATSRPGHTVFACLLIALEDLGNESHWKMSAFGFGFFHENFSQFHPLLPPEKAIFQSCLAWTHPPLVVSLLSILAPKWASWTWALCTQHCVPESNPHVPQQILTPTRFSTSYEVLSCSTQVLTARTVRGYCLEGDIHHSWCFMMLAASVFLSLVDSRLSLTCEPWIACFHIVPVEVHVVLHA